MIRPPDPGPGYRLLKPDEIIEPLDEYYYPTLHTWCKTQCDGLTAAYEGTMVLYYRRKVDVDGSGAAAKNQRQCGSLPVTQPVDNPDW